MMQELICRVFATRNAAHLVHWKTNSYATHTALGDFYEDIISAMDKLVEAFQGTFDLVKVDCDFETHHFNDMQLIKHLSDELVWIRKNENSICKDVPALVNIVQELEGVYMKALYKLENLS